MWQLDKANSESELRRALRGKLFATYLAGAPIAGIGPWIGYGVQVSTGHVLFGVIVGVLIANALGLLGFQLIWATTNKEFYKRRYGAFGQRWNGMLHDLWPMQWKSIQIALMMNLVMLPLAQIVIWVVEWLFPAGLRFVPISLVVSGTEAVLIQSTTIRLLGDLFERHSRVMARHYSPSLDSSV